MSPGSLPALLDAVVFARSYQRVERALLAFGTLLLPSSCVVCGAWDTSLCPACLAAFRKATVRPFRAEHGAESLPDVPLPEQAGAPGGGGAQPDPLYGPLPVIAAGRYHGPVPAVLLAFKNHGHVDLAAPVAAALAGALHAAVSEFPDSGAGAMSIGIVPVPTRGASRRKRGYDPLGLLLTTLRRTGSLPAGTVLLPAVHQVPLLSRLLSGMAGGTWFVRGSALRSALLPGFGGQKGLGRKRRRSRVGLSMQAARRGGSFPEGTPCIIVDDVLTTGATLGEVHRVLIAGGARVLGAVVVAATAPPAGGGGSVPLPGPPAKTSAHPGNK